MDNPLPFVWSEHSSRFRRNVVTCDTHYILFVLDTSGSIGSTNFGRMTSAISKLMALFCKPVQAVVMTFSHDFHLEFCFNCFDQRMTSQDGILHGRQSVTSDAGEAGPTQLVQLSVLVMRCSILVVD